MNLRLCRSSTCDDDGQRAVAAQCFQVVPHRHAQPLLGA